ncbi:efflux RND transporter periplasmic adaptor subunit [Pseudomaricurvus alkylphenolicus]|nr:efflux RND transporter periplasmic adaptor subunit [Pseudomaricurvus alkylphenolicus]
MSQRSFSQYGRHFWSNKNYRVSACIALASLLWLGSGIFKAQPVISEEIGEAHKPVMSVRARYIDAQAYQPQLHIRARTQANRQVSMKAEVSGKVVALPVAEGQQVKTGEVICELATEDRLLRVEEARSAVAQAQLEYDGALRLKSGGYQSRTAIAAAKAKLDSAKADLKRRQLDLDNVKIRAPFAGVLDRHSVEIGDFMDRGGECGLLLDLDPLIASGRVSETQVGQLHLGSFASARLLTGQQVGGEVSLVGYGSDDVTRTFLVEVELPNPNLSLRSGITTDLTVPLSVQTAHVIPSSLLSLDDRGKVGVRVLSEDHHVSFLNVDLIGDHSDGVWVTGLPDRALVVTVGQEYVSPGELVNATIVNPTGVNPAGDDPAINTPAADNLPAVQTAVLQTQPAGLPDHSESEPMTVVGADKL